MKKLTILFIASCFLMAGCGTKTAEPDTQPDSLAVQENSNTEEQTATEGISVYDTYEQLYEMLRTENFSAADALIKERDIDINAYEQEERANCFNTLLARFSREWDDNGPNVSVVDFLLKRSVDPNNPSIVSCEEGFSIGYTTSCDKQIAELLIKAGSKYSLDGLMQCAVNSKDISQIRALLKRDANATLAIRLACESHDATLLNDLIEAGASVNEALFWAADNEDLNMAETLIAKGAKITRSELDPYYLDNRVATSMNEELKNATVSVIDGTLFTQTSGMEGYCDPSSIIRASSEGNIKAVEFMLKAGADPNVYCWPDPGETDLQCNKTSALGAAESNGHTTLVELLKKNAAKKPEGCP